MAPSEGAKESLFSDKRPKPNAAPAKRPESWRKIVLKYQKPTLRQSIWQITNTLVPYIALWTAMYFTVSLSWPLTLALAVIAGAVLVRIFIIFHDCGHGSYFKSKRANDIVGYLSGVLTFTPYRHWRWQHAVHHGTSGNLDQRGDGDIWTMTVNEYLDASPGERLKYRISRNPFVLFVLGPIFIFLIYQRFPASNANKRERQSVHWMNAGLVVYCTAMSLIFGFWNFVWIQLTVMFIAGSAGIWIFYVQHQFEGTYWRKQEDWDYLTSAMEGSAYYKLPRILQWLSGNIGFHHIHHLSSRIPNYNLEKCHFSEPFFQQVPELLLIPSLKSLNLRLWDEESHQLVGFKHLKQLKEKQLAA
ncbi:fatty acid desaturase [Rubellicoccus peritrichatus]|uniref:Fatty acid desaturase n=1 Tax=Rubellicoccus peritrichatus TaxID=3080537 RepID=A0AAQ3L8V2_9BACT|nr:fatty acid desaturase [Puniceicoccus sp. CR14]WOO39832.1 fatty acid desaturase [Puniceicoccus sp. CR14]